ALYTRACDGGEHWGCISLASVAWGGTTGPRDVERTVSYLVRATEQSLKTRTELLANCNVGEDGCSLAALLYERGIGVSRDARVARELMRRACEAGDRAACNPMALRPIF